MNEVRRQSITPWRHEWNQIRTAKSVRYFGISAIFAVGLCFVTTIILHDIINPILDILLTQGGSPLNSPFSWQQAVIYGIDVAVYGGLLWSGLQSFRHS